jgi:hypothetical protein
MANPEPTARIYEGTFVARERALLLSVALVALAAALYLGVFPRPTGMLVSAALAAAASAAFLCGSLGLGFGAILVPALILLGVDVRVAVASSLISQLLVVPLGSASHASFGHVRARVVLPLLAAGAAGAFTGAWFSIHLEAFALTILIAASTVAMGVLVIARGVPDARALRGDGAVGRPHVLASIGFVAGFAAAAFGTGWGPVGMALLLLAGVTPRLAVGSSVTARAPIALFAVSSYVGLAGSQNVVELPVLVPILLGGVLGILPGAVVARRMDGRRLAQLFGVTVAILGLLVLLRV